MMRRFGLAAALTMVLLTTVPGRAVSGLVTTHGYIPMADGVTLHYTLLRPSSTGRFPVLFIFDPYGAGDDPARGSTGSLVLSLLRRDGFAILGVNVRGTGCSGGVWSVLDPQEGKDGARIVEWAARQPWSNGHVGMMGASYPGMVQFLVAGQRPPHLDAIAPGQILGDAYRDTAYPGGIFNRGFAGLYTAAQKESADQSAATGFGSGHVDTRCLANIAQQSRERPFFPAMLRAPYIDSPALSWRSHSPDTSLASIDVPVLSTRGWQDEEAGDRGSYVFQRLNQTKLWTIQSDGGHDYFYGSVPGITDAIERFLVRYVKCVDNGWEQTPHVQIYHELSNTFEPSWVTTYDSWPPPATPLRLYLGSGGTLGLGAPTANGGSDADAYAYPELAPSVPENDLESSQPQPSPTWDIPPTRGGYLTYTTPALTRDVELLGSGNADLWLASTATDTDLQITLTEVRPDGQEVYIQRGWLRASHRKEDPALSTDLRPLHTDLAEDARRLTPGQPTHLRVELFPFEHVFRAGSAIRLIIDAPTGLVGDWELGFLNTPAVNTILHDASHPSSFVLPLVDGSAPTPFPACGTVLSEPCRDSIAPVPPGSLAPPVE